METRGFAPDGDQETRTVRSRGGADRVVLRGREGAELEHLAEHEDEAALFAFGDGRRGLEPGDHRGPVGVVGVVQEASAVG